MTIIWCMVPQIWSVTDRMFCYFGLVFALLPPNNSKNQNFEKKKTIPVDIIILDMCTINYNYKMCGSWDTECDRQIFFVILDHFLLFYPPNNPKNQNFEKMKKMPRDIIILHKCTKNHDDMLHCSWDMMHDGCKSCFLFWAISCPFTS